MEFTHTTTDEKHLPLTPIIHPWIREVVSNQSLLEEAVSEFQSPLNIQSLVPFEENVNAFKSVFDKYELQHRIYFARKANKCISYTTHAAELGEGVDTASFEELAQCLEAGINPAQLISTAAVKTQRLMELAVDNGVTIIIDNLDELDLLEKVTERSGKQAHISLRVGGFDMNGATLHSRFGFSIAAAQQLVLEKLIKHPTLLYTGLHFHLNGYSIPERAVAIGQCIALVDALKAHQIDTLHLDIGGGYLVNYLSDKAEWNTFQSELKRAVLRKRPELTYRNDPLGIVKIENTLYGEAKVYPYYSEVHKAGFLENILTSAVSGYDAPIHQLLRDRRIEIRIEPGRSLLDQAGITVARVAFRKHDSAGNLLVGLEMNRTQMKSSSADFLLDPIHLSTAPSSESDLLEESKPVFGYLVGAYCLEQEFILLRKIKFHHLPSVGDLIVFVNTAGYMMHFFESQAHQFALAENVFYNKDKSLRVDK
ncbi:Y4yA family PLP-dependent enzyme [Sphingobacterium sp. lm-10]|uniref:Y4yA family PLP-dependent enzyme n=1 Tax=Sphingobacterium sp. lm-10 TaxID=2944904 RepID=UPI0020227897|nr:Y4yA family PLP-dependent enzyme [Sphingobacterium sp. lm-10]MCL7987269.1 Y4yA family PLP-dependent enzyme [Sphingobacterium sp. lm-10]